MKILSALLLLLTVSCKDNLSDKCNALSDFSEANHMYGKGLSVSMALYRQCSVFPKYCIDIVHDSVCVYEYESFFDHKTNKSRKILLKRADRKLSKREQAVVIDFVGNIDLKRTFIKEKFSLLSFECELYINGQLVMYIRPVVVEEMPKAIKSLYSLLIELSPLEINLNQ